jgi:hypothetical protein
VVDEVHARYRGRLNLDKVKATLPESRRYLAAIGLSSHGVIVYDARGALVWKTEGHEFDGSGLESAVRRVTGGAP